MTNKQTVGEKELSGSHVNKLNDTINDEYQYEMWVDDLPVFGRVGFAQPNEVMGGKLYFLITHHHFHIRYNQEQVFTVNISRRLQPGHYVEIKCDTPLEQVHFDVLCVVEHHRHRLYYDLPPHPQERHGVLL